MIQILGAGPAFGQVLRGKIVSIDSENDEIVRVETEMLSLHFCVETGEMLHLAGGEWVGTDLFRVAPTDLLVLQEAAKTLTQSV